METGVVPALNPNTHFAMGIGVVFGGFHRRLDRISYSGH